MSRSQNLKTSREAALEISQPQDGWTPVKNGLASRQGRRKSAVNSPSSFQDESPSLTTTPARCAGLTSNVPSGQKTVVKFMPIIVIIAWIMDEGRKIQEEQELTV
jgi:hypothetical protein